VAAPPGVYEAYEESLEGYAEPAAELSGGSASLLTAAHGMVRFKP
jgi:hypothetical protein